MTHKQTAIAQIAKEHLFIETLEVRSSDSLDFHDCGVVSLKRALEAAYEAGQIAAKKPKRTLKKNSRIGTSYRAAVKIKYQELVDTWGAPQDGSDDKVEAEWVIKS